ncbi:hypothetical protein Q1695_002202 [Nippostrongylus brasiliensis]|nr:hypothetical protein Q1695_002202 [Nippostrongylus brasiliensis]
MRSILVLLLASSVAYGQFQPWLPQGGPGPQMPGGFNNGGNNWNGGQGQFPFQGGNQGPNPLGGGNPGPQIPNSGGNNWNGGGQFPNQGNNPFQGQFPNQGNNWNGGGRFPNQGNNPFQGGNPGPQMNNNNPWSNNNRGGWNNNNGFGSCSSPMSSAFRDVALRMHNEFRSYVAVGLQARNGFYQGREIAPPASLMYQLQYDCDAEMYAYRHVSTCDQRASDQGSRPGWKENFNVFQSSSSDELTAIQNAISTWTGRLATEGLPSDMIFSNNNRVFGPQSGRLALARTLWGTNRRVGCATQQCSGFYFTSCMYSDIVNTINTPIYPVGAVCSGCTGGACTKEYGLCQS